MRRRSAYNPASTMNALSSRIAGVPAPVLLYAAGLLLAYAAPLPACDVPVCEYALRYWARSDYTVYYLYEGREAPADAAANALLRRAAAGDEGHANLRFVPLESSPPPDRLTPEAREILAANRTVPRPRHLLVSPTGATVYSGRLAAEDVRALLASPATAALAEALCAGARGVLLLLTDTDEAQNAGVRGVVQQALAAAPETARPLLQELSRQDPAEQWLVRQLLALEPDLPSLRSPMVFGVYGRCRATEPYLGKGLTPANLSAVARFLNGPCTCEIKEANRGVDLLSNWDWPARVPEAALPPRRLDGGGYVEFEQ